MSPLVVIKIWQLFWVYILVFWGCLYKGYIVHFSLETMVEKSLFSGYIGGDVFYPSKHSFDSENQTPS